MPKKRKEPVRGTGAHGVINRAGETVEERITDTLEKNYMPYAMSVILSRAIPEIDGFKPSHRKLLYTMYKMGLLGPGRTKSANIVGQTMRLNPHGDAPIYDTMVRLSRGYEALLHPYVDSKGNFGKFYSRDMAYAASRYTEARLDNLCEELFRDIDRDTVDFVDNYDRTMKEPTLLPATFPTVLVNANTGIAVGMASSICPFNLAEVCKTTAALLKNQQHDIFSTLLAPDFPGGGQILMNRDTLKKIYETGRGSIRVRSRYRYDADANCIDVVEIPPTATVEVIVEKVVDLVRQGKVKEISDIRDETGLDGLKITIDLKRGTDPDKLMLRLFKMTPLEDSFSCNFNVLVNGTPRVMGVRELLNEWSKFRVKCVRRRTEYDLKKKQEKLHLLKGLQAILLDIDKAVAIVRSTEGEEEVVPNLMIGFGIDRTQAEYVAEIKLRHLNREYIMKRTEETAQLELEIAKLQKILGSEAEIRKIICNELNQVAEKYGKPRRSELIYPGEIEEYDEEEIPDYPVNLFLTKDGYFKKITPLSLRMGGEQKLKEGDEVGQHIESTNSAELLFFTNRCSVYKAKASDFPDMKASVLGEYIPARLGMEDGETPVYLAVTTDYAGFMMFFYENGKASKVDLTSYETKTNRRRLVNAYSDKSPLVSCTKVEEDREFLLVSSQGRMLLLHSGAIQSKTTRSTQGVAVMTLKRSARLLRADPYREGSLQKPDRYRKTIPAAGSMPAAEDTQGEQMTL
ncbi:DNA gyrase subunit A [Caprobacter fermentans]|uniref:DNA gyrase subunit A n=1 Tax=Caproicibacter fermentans TaxID=2576756 RepID=A0A6N8I509_9FIRM|nr:DNA topoisomerase (ATP-hydrolyzing) subunit A [Caproicibacter fermentans]MVB12857.1 DNA gyrase subunit A [Caproicibacter fermentans]OCN02344.1 topoisomerase IV [Clostridium sp. W14A]